MKLLQLQYFQAVCTFGSTMRAAEMLFVSQPSISNAINKLEKELGVQLFTRQSNRLVLTEYGRLFFEKVTAILNSVDELKSSAQRMSIANNLHVSIPPIVGDTLPGAFREFRALNPSCSMAIHEEVQSEMLHMLETNQRDLAVTIIDNIMQLGYEIVPLINVELLFVTHKDSGLAACDSVSFKDIGTSPIVLFKENYFQRSLIMERFHNAKIIPNVVLYANQLNSLYGYILQNEASAFLFGKANTSIDQPCIKLLHLDPPIYVTIGMVYATNKPLTATLKSLISCLTKHFQEESGNGTVTLLPSSFYTPL